MALGRQLRLFGIGSGEGHLFATDVLRRYLDQHKGTAIPDVEARARRVREWLRALDRTDAGEATLEIQFVTQVLSEVLGYIVHPSPGASLYPKPPFRITHIKGTPDAILGAFDGADPRFSAVVELKSPGVNLDLPQPGHGYKTPVEQAFDYGARLLGVRWVIVSDMRVMRLYAIESPDEYELVDLGGCVDGSPGGSDGFRRLHFLLHRSYLVEGDENSQVARLYEKSLDRQLAMRDGFYGAYYEIRADLYDAVRTASAALTPTPAGADLLEATQRLLDRLLFMYYCEDHPQQLIPRDTMAKVTQAARNLPGSSSTKVYDNLKLLFREVDVGSPAASGARVPGYNGELFKEHWIVDHISLPDSLDDRRYAAVEPKGRPRQIKGAWGLHVYDFWTELNEYLLGHVFEESLSDLGELGTGRERPLSERLAERKRHGIFFTTSILSDFLSASALEAVMDDIAPLAGDDPRQLQDSLAKRRERLLSLRVVDFACGSGAFLASAYRWMIQEFWRIQSALDGLAASASNLFDRAEVTEQAAILRDCLFGADILPQAAEIAKLALWLRSARKGEKVADLSRNIIAADTLDPTTGFCWPESPADSFDLVIGNPPWGGEVEAGSRQLASEALGLPDHDNRDSWELFLLLAVRALREGGRLALVLPDSFFYPEKARTREALFAQVTVEKVHSLGPDWFGSQVRMGTVLLQARRGPVDVTADMLCMLLTGELRREVIRGRVPLSQAESQRSRLVPIIRTVQSPASEVEVFRGTRDDAIMERMIDRSAALSRLCERARGEEMNKAGLAWECPSCLALNTPGAKTKGGGYKDKQCGGCGHSLTEATVRTVTLVAGARPELGDWVPFVDGDDVRHRYQALTPGKWWRTDLSVGAAKRPELYRPPKILVRQAGIGLIATLDRTPSRCPQSVYIYRLRSEREAEGYQHEFVLGALVSRTMTYFVMKRFAETDPAKAFAKLTHERLADLPVPRIDFSDRDQRRAHDAVVANVRSLLTGAAKLGGEEDLETEQILRDLWGIGSADGAYINGEFWYLPESQAIRDLFPTGPPRPTGPTVEGDE